MKIKRVEIQAFRAYDRVEDSTFDFKIGHEEYADFICLYAPNGFGKTSFYDAIEYSYTNNIDRLLKNKNNKEVAKSEKNISKSEKQYILRNRLSDPKLDSYVKLLTTTGNIDKRIVEPRRNASDYKFDDNETERKYFREVILSQDWISSFLKEDKADERFAKFIEYFGDRKLDNYRKNLDDLISKNEKELKSFVKDLGGIQTALKLDFDINLLVKVNDKINSLNSQGNNFKAVDTQTSRNDILDITNAISERKNELNFNIKKNRESIAELEILITGNEQLQSFRLFKESLENFTSLSKKLHDLVSIKTKFDELEQKKDQLELVRNRTKNLETEKIEKEKILVLLQNYEKLNSKLEEDNKNVSVLKEALENLFQEISDDENVLKDDNIKAENFQKRIDEIEKNSTELSNILKNIDDWQIKINEYNQELDSRNNSLQNKKNEHEVIENDIAELKKILFEIDLNKYPSEFDPFFDKYIIHIQKINETEKYLDLQSSLLQDINNQIAEQQSFQKDLDLFISKGLSIINEQKNSTCPLCNQDFETYDKLVNIVTNNKFLSERMSSLINQKNEIEIPYQSFKDNLKNYVKEFILQVKKDISIKEQSSLDLKKDISDLNNNIEDFSSKLKSASKSLEDEKALIYNMSQEEYRTWATKALNDYKAELSDVKDKIQLLTDKLLNKKDQHTINKDKLEILLSEIEEVKKSSIFKDVINYFTENFPNQDITTDFLNNNIKIVNENIQANLNLTSDLLESLKALELELNDSNLETIQNEITQLNYNMNQISSSIEIYKLNAGKYISSEIEKMDESIFSDTIAKLKEKNEKDVSLIDQEISDLELLLELKDNVLPYLEFEENKKKESDIKNSISKKKKITTLLKVELKKVNSHIEKQIKSFFYEDLINDLYKRIDPHPEYTKVKFVPDFKDSKPKLNVCVYDKNNIDDFIIPNLYFSQAQLNILSLCIFLAKALNATDDDEKPIDCIFVDDPIQSMDSINILSTIDLLRSIFVNQGKQIILSTHDENFHNLLKKKIPHSLFKSKFMELETFGKLK